MLVFDISHCTELCLELDEWRERLDSRLTLRRDWEGRLRRDLEAEAIAASTSMEGVDVTVDEVRHILAGDSPPRVAAEDQRLVEGYREAMGFVLRRADDPNFRWDRELLVNLQDRVLGGHFGAGAGRLRTGAIVVANERGVVFRPPPANRVAALVDELCGQLAGAEWHPAIASAWAHVAIAAVHPFRDGNGRTARVAASLAMYLGGFRRKEFTSLEEWWGRHRADYYRVFTCLGDEFDERADVTQFIVQHLGAQLTQVRALDMAARSEQLIWVALADIAEAGGLPARLVNGLWECFLRRPLSAGYYRSVADIAPATASKDLAAAAAAGLIVPEGRTRGRAYGPSSRLYREVGERFHLDGAALEALDPRLIVTEVARQLAIRPGAFPGSADADRLLRTVPFLGEPELHRLQIEFGAQVHGDGLERVVAAVEGAYRELFHRPTRLESWQAVERRLADLLATPDAVGLGWPGRFAETEVARRALLGVVARDLLDDHRYRALVAPMAAVAPWLLAGR